MLTYKWFWELKNLWKLRYTRIIFSYIIDESCLFLHGSLLPSLLPLRCLSHLFPPFFLMISTVLMKPILFIATMLISQCHNSFTCLLKKKKKLATATESKLSYILNPFLFSQVFSSTLVLHYVWYFSQDDLFAVSYVYPGLYTVMMYT